MSAPEPAADEPAKAPARKIGLIDMVVYVEQQAQDVDIWEDVLRREGKPLYEGMVQKRVMFRKIAVTLELLMAHEKEFVAMVHERREKERARLAAAGVRRAPSPSVPPAPSSAA